MTKKQRMVRKVAGELLIGGARAMESCAGFTADVGLINRKCMTKKENRALDKAQIKLIEGTRILRVLGNHLANPKAKT